ncbi:DNA repair and recombination protein RadB [Candidatus Woesearchaeota archaeon]|nr:DNA repair and recombination protein RadB [Candidatus Woesearchaeota archaeon]
MPDTGSHHLRIHSKRQTAFIKIATMQSRKLATGNELTDDLLQGGFEFDAITTIYGPAGAGKTNLALLAAIETAKAGKKVIFIDTEGGFSVSRLKQLLPEYKKLLDKIVFLRPTTFEEQKVSIERLKELVNNKIGLIIVDTITMLYRLQRSFKEDDTHNQDLSLQMLILNEIARKHNIPVLLISQVYSSFENRGVKIVGGDILNYTSKCMLELENMQNGVRKIILKKHRSIACPQERQFIIIEKGIEKKE